MRQEQRKHKGKRKAWLCVLICSGLSLQLKISQRDLQCSVLLDLLALGVGGHTEPDVHRLISGADYRLFNWFYLAGLREPCPGTGTWGINHSPNFLNILSAGIRELIYWIYPGITAVTMMYGLIKLIMPE